MPRIPLEPALLVAAAILGLAACGGSPPGGAADGATADAAFDPAAAHTYPFGPYSLQPGEEVVNHCVQITLGNPEPIYVNSVELTTGAGFHHSNWFYVPEADYFGPDGTWDCDSRNFSEPSAAIFGGVLFAQSTQDPHEIQAFPAGAAVYIPAHSKLVAQIHLLDSSDSPLSLSPTITLVPIAAADVTTRLAAVSFEDQALGLPPHAASRFTIDCDLAPQSQMLTGADPAFHLYYALAHYHALGSGLTFEAVKPDGTASTIYSTANHVGDTLGGPLSPPFDMTGYTRMRVSCDYENDTDEVVGWGVGNQEMCVFLAFSDSPYDWAGGVTTPDAPGDPTMVGGVATFTHACAVFATDAQR